MTDYTTYAKHGFSADVGSFGTSLGGSHTSAMYQNTFNQEFKVMNASYVYASLYETEFDYAMFPGFF